MSKKHLQRIVFAVHSLQAGGMERVVSEISSNFAANKKFDVHIILYGIKRDIFYSLSDAIKIHKPNFKFNNERRFFSTLKTLSYVRNKVKSLEPDTVVSFGEYWNNLVLLATIGLKFPIYIADRSQPLKNLGFLQNNLRKLLYPRADGLILQTHMAKTMYEKRNINSNITVIGNPIKDTKSENVERENIVLMVGRLIDTKHQNRLIELFSRINNQKWKLVLVGGDAKKQQNKSKLTTLIKRLQLEDRVILAGTQKDVHRYYMKSKIFAFTSSSEGFPNVIGEAMSAGLPVVSYDCMAGPADMITNNEDGFLIPVFEDELFRSKLEMIMNDDTLRVVMGEKAEKSIKRFNQNTIAEKYLDFILN